MPNGCSPTNTYPQDAPDILQKPSPVRGKEKIATSRYSFEVSRSKHMYHRACFTFSTFAPFFHFWQDHCGLCPSSVHAGDFQGSRRMKGERSTSASRGSSPTYYTINDHRNKDQPGVEVISHIADKFGSVLLN